MELTEEQIQGVLKKVEINACPNCKSKKNKHLRTNEYQLIGYNRVGHTIKFGGEMSVIPLVAGVCEDCGYVMLFDTQILGITE